MKAITTTWTCDWVDKGKACGQPGTITASLVERVGEEERKLSVDLCVSHSATLVANARPDESVSIRQWASTTDGADLLKRKKLEPPSDKGRIAAGVVKAYNEATGA